MKLVEEQILGELALLARAGVPLRTLRLRVRELVVVEIAASPPGSPAATAAVATAVRAAARLAEERQGAPELLAALCAGALDAVRGHGGESAQWLADARRAALRTLEERAGRAPCGRHGLVQVLVREML